MGASVAILIPSLSAVSGRMTGGERRLAQRLGDKLDDDYLCWYDVSIGERLLHPDFVVFHPQRGLLVLEVKDWKLDTLHGMDKQTATILTDHGLKQVLNPLEQARQYMFAVISKMERDPQLVWPTGSLKGKPFFPYGHGVVLTNISRKQFDGADLGSVLPPHLVVCQDEMLDSVDSEAFQQRFWNMFPIKFKMPLSLPQIGRIRWHMFPDIRIPAQPDLFEASGDNVTEIPDVLRVMDLQQEQLARSLGAGHRVIHGVAGSGKTLILGYRAEQLAAACARPILILCYNKSLAAMLEQHMAAKGLQDKVHVVNFHAWCSRQLVTYNAGKPPKTGGLDAYFEACVERVIQSVDRKLIPSGQYDAVLIDEGHDFKPEWFKLIVQMVHPDSNSVLVLYDDAQSIYGGAKKLKFSFSSVGIKARGHTTILKLNYRNTAEILSVAHAFADELLTQNDTDEDVAPTVKPMSTGRHGPKPLFIKLPCLAAEAAYLVDRLTDANRTGTPWRDMAIIYRRYGIGQQMAELLERRGIPFQLLQDKAKKNAFLQAQDSVKIVTMHSSKGLEFPFVWIPAVGAPGKEDEQAQDEARLLYVAMTRATRELLMTHSDSSPLVARMEKAMTVLHAM